MKNGILFIISLVLLGCGGSKIVQTKEMNSTGKSYEDTATVTENNVIEQEAEGKSNLTSKSNNYSSASEIEEMMVFLTSDELQGRDTGTEGIATAATYIIDAFKKNGIQPYFKSYRDTLSNYNQGPAFNVVGVLPGTDAVLKNELIIIGAHYDHLGLIADQDGDAIANGANDNASGTTTVLQLASYFGKYKTNKRTLIFALFSAEEKGLLGSKHLAAKLKAQNSNLYAMLNFEMVGVPMKDKDHSLYLTGYKLSNLAEVSNKYANKKLVGFLPKAKEFNLFRRSDNAPFHDAFNVPSQTYCSFDFTNFGHYHKVGDEAEKMDFEFMANIVNDIIPVITGIANSKTKEIKYN